MLEGHAIASADDAYTRNLFAAEDVVAWARRRNPRIAERDQLLCGVSLSGLAAAHAALLYPDKFCAALCQSGSFWWLADHEVELPPTSARFWLSVGSEETDTEVSHPPSGMFQRINQVEGVETAARRLEALGGRVRCRTFAGGHAFEPWREELAPALTWLLGDGR